MSHLTTQSAYTKLVDRLNQFPQGAPPSDLLYKILKVLFSAKEAGIVAMLPIRPFTVKRAAKILKKPESETRNILENLADRGILLDIGNGNQSFYVLPPPMAGFFEFSLMRVHRGTNQKLLSELFYQYINVEDNFIKALFMHGDTQLGRIFVNEPALLSNNSLHVLEYEKASQVIKTASHRAIGVCYCRHKMKHVGRACDAPMEICMTFNSAAKSLIKHKIARQVDVSEGLDLLKTAYDRNLVQFGENVQEGVSFICNCCSCCCEAMLAARRFGSLVPIHTTRFIPLINKEKCTGCGKCVSVCPMEALSLVSAHDSNNKNKKQVKLDKKICLGCGVCVRNCPNGCLKLTNRKNKIITPLDSTHRTVMMAIERGKLQNLIFDTQALWNHRAMAAILGTILKLPPIKQTLASEQIKSRYLAHMISKYKKNHSKK